MSRTFVIGDIHGCLEEFQALVTALHLADSDVVVCVGDFLDKGPDPVASVQLARKLGFQAVLGNHEEKALRWLKHEDHCRSDLHFKNPMASRAYAEAW